MTIIDLLEREATGLNAANDATGGPDDETWSEYIGDLADLTLQLNDPRSLRGQAFISK